MRFELATYRLRSGRAASEPRGLLLPSDEIDSLLKVQILTWQMVVWGPAQKEPTRFKIDLHCPYRDVESPARALCYPRVPDQSMVLASIWTVLRPPTSPAAGGHMLPASISVGNGPGHLLREL